MVLQAKSKNSTMVLEEPLRASLWSLDLSSLVGGGGGGIAVGISLVIVSGVFIAREVSSSGWMCVVSNGPLVMVADLDRVLSCAWFVVAIIVVECESWSVVFSL